MRILIIDNNVDPKCWGSSDLCGLVHESLGPSSGATVIVRRGPGRDLPQGDALFAFDHVIISGSRTSALADAPWISELHELIRKTADRKVPMLGVCYGHQSIARALGAGKSSVRKAAEAEIGWTRIEIVKPSPLTQGLSDSFHSFAVHYDEVCELPPGASHLARSKACEYQAFQIQNRPIFGIQFHPEKDLADAQITFEEKRKTDKKLLLFPSPSEGKKLYDPNVGRTLFRNFLSL